MLGKLNGLLSFSKIVQNTKHLWGSSLDNFYVNAFELEAVWPVQDKLPTPETHGEAGSVHPKRSQKAALQHVK